MENHHKYIDEFRTPITEGEYMQMSAIYKTKEAKQVRYTFLDLATSTTYKVVEFGNGEARVTPELPPEQQLTIPDWLDEILPKQTEEEWLEIWRQGMDARRKERYQHRKQMRNKYGWKKRKPKGTLKKLYRAKEADLKQQLRQANQTIGKLKREHDREAGIPQRGSTPKPIQSNLVYDIYNYALNRGVVSEREYCTALNIKANHISSIFYEGNH